MGDLYTDTTTGDLYTKQTGTGDTGWVLATGGTGVVGDHGGLSGLSDDDHPQYARVFVQTDEPTSPREGDLWAAPGTRAVPAFVQEKAGWVVDTTAPYDLTITPDSATTAGNTIIVNVGHTSEDAAPTISDSAGNTYTLLARIGSADGAANAYGSQYVCFNAAAATWVKSTITTTSRSNLVQVVEFSGLASTRATNKYVGSNTSLAATNTSGDLIVCMGAGLVATVPATTGGTGYTALDDQYHAASNANSLLGAYRVSAVDNTAGATFTGFGTHGLITSSFVPGWA